MNLSWSAGEYELELESSREHHLVRDTLVEAAYVVERLPDEEWVARLGRTKVEVGRFVDDWSEFRLSRRIPVADLEFITSCFRETLDFFSDTEYLMRTGWTKEESSRLFARCMEDRKKITVQRQWG